MLERYDGHRLHKVVAKQIKAGCLCRDKKIKIKFFLPETFLNISLSRSHIEHFRR